MSRWRRLAALSCLAASAVAWGLLAGPAQAARPTLNAAREEQSCGGLLGLGFCPTPTSIPVQPTSPPGPQPFTLPPVTDAPSLPSTTAPATPGPSTSPTPETAGPPLPPPTPTPRPTPVTVGNDRSFSIPTITPTDTGSSLDGGGLLIRLFFLLAVLGLGSVASLFALR